VRARVTLSPSLLSLSLSSLSLSLSLSLKGFVPLNGAGGMRKIVVLGPHATATG
jgi:hypothetical protein